ncbi:MAG: VanW family protein [Clostridia bacterium]|nr:VanW family protein [Clostridia bacterium]
MQKNPETKEKKNKDRGLKSKDLRVVILVSVLAVLILLGTLSAFASSYDKIYSNIYVGEVELGNKTQQQAYELLVESYGESLPTIIVSAENKKIEIPFTDIAEYDFVKTSEVVFQKGRTNFATSFFTYITPFVKRNVPIYVEIDDEKLENSLADLQSKIKNGYQKPTYRIEESTLFILTGHGGKAIDMETLKAELIKNLEQNKSVSINADIIDKEFEPLNVDKVYNDIFCEPQDAYYDKENNCLVPHVDGHDFDKNTAKNVLMYTNEDSEYSIPLSVVPANKTIKDLEEELFSDKLGTYTTYYTAGNVNRSHNVALAASKLDGYIMMPGEVFSYNDVVGERTAARGFRNAAVYTANGVENGIGGGICQVSSTLYNSVLYANLEIVSRTNHSYTVSYAPKGQDATVSMGTIDFKFKNNHENPIMLKAYVGGGACTISVYGKKTEDFSVEVISTVLSTTPYSVKYEDDPEMPLGEEKIKTEGMTGYTVSTVRNVTINGKTTTEKMPNSRYIPLTQVVTRGTKEEEPVIADPENPEISVENTEISTENPSVNIEQSDLDWIAQ